MKTKIPMNWSNKATQKSLLLGTVAAAALLAAPMVHASGSKSPVGDVFVILYENHNLTQPNPTNGTQQILGNPAAPYINSLMTPGNPNAAQVSYATAYYNTGTGVHPSEPNYVWDEAGTDFGFHSDADPSFADGNQFYDNAQDLVSQINDNGNKAVFWHFTMTPHLTGQLDDMGIPWKNYQEDVQLSVSPTNSASGNNGPTNIYNGSTQYSYAVKHNPAALFGRTAEENIYPLSQLFLDLNSNTVGRFNWITPDQFNEAHSSLSGGFTYQGVHYTGDQAAVAEGDNFLSIVLPEIMASQAYQNNGVIVILWDETEGGDTASYTLPEIVISPLAKGNAYASSVPMSHSSDLKTWEEVFGLPFVNNPIPVSETNVETGYNNVATVNDLSDMFVAGTIPAAPSFSVTSSGFFTDPFTHHVRQTVQITNNGSTPVSAPLFLALDNLSSNATLINSDGTTQILAPLGSPFVDVPIFGILFPGQSTFVTLQFLDPSASAITYNSRVLNVTPAP